MLFPPIWTLSVSYVSSNHLSFSQAWAKGDTPRADSMESKALGLFVAAGTAVTLVVVLRRLRDKSKSGDGNDKQRLGHRGGVWRGSGDDVWVSERAKGLLGGGGPAYIMEHIARLGDTYDEVTAPAGYICLAIAENKISFPLLSSRLAAARRDLSLSDMGYNDPRGSHVMRREIASLLSSHVAHRRVDPESIACTSGATGVLNQLIFCTCSENDIILIPAPYYTGFDSNLADPRLGVRTVPVQAPPDRPFWDIDAVLHPANLEAHLMAAARSPGGGGALLVTNPHNPTGLCYGAEALIQASEWAHSKGLHLIIDEVYALSEHGGGWGEAPPGGAKKFFSAGALWEPLPEHVHVIWGFSKDFGCAGWRVGVLFTENSAVNSAFRSLGHASESSTDTLAQLSQVLSSDGFAEYYTKGHVRCIGHAYGCVSQALLEAGIDFLPNNAGLFVLLDLRKHLPSQDVAGEDLLWHTILHQTNVNLTPGQAMHCREVGWFRLCYAYVDPAVVKLAIRRLTAVVGTAEWRQRNRSLSG